MGNDEPVSILNDEVAVTADTAPAPDEAIVHEEIRDASKQDTSGIIESDVIVVGAGFSGITAIDRFRKIGMRVKCFESGSDFGGVW
jgi:ribulose 1,5-bisphosphate synthetase/thiazole synthase